MFRSVCKVLGPGVLLAGAAAAQQYVMSTYAGGGPPQTPVAGLLMSVPAPQGIVTDAAGNVYFGSSNCVFKVDGSGMVTRIAGNSRMGHSGDGGLATDAQLSYLGSLARDGAGNLYISDSDRVRRVSPSGIITTVAGSGTLAAGSVFVPATSVALNLSNGGGIAVDGAGSLFIMEGVLGQADFFSIRKVLPNGIITTVAGGTTFTPTLRLGPLAVDGSGNLLFGNGSQVLKLSPQGTVALVAGNGKFAFSGDGGPATAAGFYDVESLALDGSGNVFVADGYIGRIRKIAPSGIVTTVAGGGPTYGDGEPATTAILGNLLGVAVDGTGNLLIADQIAGSIRKVGADGIIHTVAGVLNAPFSGGDGGPATGAQLGGAADVAMDSSGNLFIAEADYRRVRKVSPDGIIATVAGDGSQPQCINLNNCDPVVDGGPAAGAHLGYPEGVAVDRTGNLYIADTGANLVRKVTPGGIITTVAQLSEPFRVAVDAAGNLFVLNDQGIHRVSPDGTTTNFAGNGKQGFSGDGGPATAAELDLSDDCEGLGGGLAVDSAGDVLIADTFNNRVREISASGTIVTVAGQGDFSFSGDGGPAASATLKFPFALAVDGAGNLFVADTDNNRVRMISPSGIITTVAGNGSYTLSGDGGPALRAGVGFPVGVAADATGNVYVAGNNVVYVLRPTSHNVLIGAVLDAASQQASAISPGKIVVIYGAGLGPAQLVQNQPTNGLLGASAGGTNVAFNGVAAPVLYALDTQVAAIVPYSITTTAAQVTVTYNGETSAGFSVPAAPSAPSLFTMNQSGAGQAAAINAVDGTFNSAAKPVKIGGYISLYATGEGQTSPGGVDGALSSTSIRPVLPVTATIGGIPATVQFAGEAPGQVAGLMQVNLQVPSGVQPGGYVPVVLQVGNASTTPDAVWIAVGN